MKEIVRNLIGKLIISCQAYEDTPLYGAENMKTMAASVLMGGAEAIRACWPQDIRAIRSLGDFPIIGLNKVIDPNKQEGNYIIITPTFESAAEVIEAGCDVLALDCRVTDYRGKEELYNLLKEITENYPDIAIMADCETLEDCINAESTGMVDILATTLAGSHRHLEHPDADLVREIKKHCTLPVNAEGAVWDLNDLKSVIDAGADMVCIGTAVTRPHLIAQRFIQFNKAVRG
ncbi:MAG: N-acylglucosamine-6-phosphate 2-epimerase [Erysipelotrichaceae bacterium]|nr:N-acylglucosamine-6-phosphate 2-epimerase [Erysipelotrichaceae bacterium]